MSRIRKLWFYRYYLFTLIFIIFLGCVINFIFIKKIKYNDHYIWTDVTFIGHGAYGIDELDYTNSVEALKLGYDSGIRIMEVDFLFTSDGELVSNHYWQNDTWESYNTFLSKKIKNSYTTMDVDMLLRFMSEYKDLYIVIDTKENEYDNNKTVLNVYEEIVSKTKDYDESLLGRFIVQLYGFDDLKEINKIYKFDNKMFTIYKLGIDFNIYEIVYYCLFNDIESIVIPYTHIYYNLIDEANIRFIRSKNINVYINTINDEKIYNELLKMGVTGVYTDFLN